MKRMTRMGVFMLAVTAVAGVYADYAGMKRDALKRKRDVMYLACGYEACLWPKSIPFSVANFPSIRLDALKKTPVNVDTVIYQPIGVFGCLSAKIPSAEMPKLQPTRGSSWMLAGIDNHLADLVKAGTDPVKETVKWCRANKKEIVISLPVNTTEHANMAVDAKLPPAAPVIWNNYFFPTWKSGHMNMLLGGPGAQVPKDHIVKKHAIPTQGEWSMVDYGQTEVRQKYIKMATEIADNYEIDGLLVDFMKSPVLFMTVAWGGTASAKECQQITDMLIAVKAALDKAGEKRGRPILLSIRVPDSIPYCKDIGIDLQALLDQKIPDYLLFGGSFELNPASWAGDLSAKSGIPWYRVTGQSGIWVGNDSGYNNDDELIPRHSAASFRGRAMEAKVAKASGCVWENPYHWIRFPLGAIQGPTDAIVLENKRYYVSYVSSSSPNAYLKEGAKHRTIQTLVSGSPMDMRKGPAKVQLNVWDDFEALKKQNVRPRCILITEAVIPGGMDVLVTLNGKPVELLMKRAGHQYFAVPQGLAKFGANEVIVKASGRNKRGLSAKLGNVAMDVIFKETPETLAIKRDPNLKGVIKAKKGKSK